VRPGTGAGRPLCHRAARRHSGFALAFRRLIEPIPVVPAWSTPARPSRPEDLGDGGERASSPQGSLQRQIGATEDATLRRVQRKLALVIALPLVLALFGAAAGGGTIATGGFWLGAVVVSIWALADAVGRPRYAWEAAGANRTMWLVLLTVGLLLCGVVSYIAAVMYFVTIQRRLQLAT